MGDKDDEDKNPSLGAGRYPVMPSLVMLQQMRNRLHLAYLGRKLMKWSAMATGRELRKVSHRLAEVYDGLGEEIRTAFIMLARCRFYVPDINALVLEDIQKEACLTIVTTMKVTAGVKYYEYQCHEIEPVPAAYPHLGIGAGGQHFMDTKKSWSNLLKKIILMSELRSAFMVIEASNLNATKKMNIQSKVVIPKTLGTVNYILSELGNMGREDFFKLKKDFDTKILKKKLAEWKEKPITVRVNEVPEIGSPEPRMETKEEIADAKEEIADVLIPPTIQPPGPEVKQSPTILNKISNSDNRIVSKVSVSESDRYSVDSSIDLGDIETEISIYTRVVRSMNSDGTISESKRVVKVTKEVKRPKRPFENSKSSPANLTSQSSCSTVTRCDEDNKTQGPFYVDETILKELLVSPKKSWLFPKYNANYCSNSLPCMSKKDNANNENRENNKASQSLVDLNNEDEVIELLGQNENSLDNWSNYRIDLLREISEDDYCT